MQVFICKTKFYMELNKSYSDSVCIQQVVVKVACIQDWPSVSMRTPASNNRAP